jgi:hypothetical protein
MFRPRTVAVAACCPLGSSSLTFRRPLPPQGLAGQCGEDAEVAHIAAQLAGRGHAVQRHPDRAGDAVPLRPQRDVGQVQPFALQCEGSPGVEWLFVHERLGRQGAA